MANIFLKKAITSVLNISNEQADAILNAAEAFNNSEIDKNRAIRIFNKLTKKTPKELNEILRCVDGMIQ